MNNSWSLLAEGKSTSDLSSINFWSGLTVWINRPHLINIKILCAEQLGIFYDIEIHELRNSFCDGNFCRESIDKLSELNLAGYVELSKEGTNCFFDEKAAIQKNNALIFRNLLPRETNKYEDVLEAIYLDFFEDSATFFPQNRKSNITPTFPYKLKLTASGINLEVLQLSSTNDHEFNAKSRKWLESKVLTKILKWCQDIPSHPIVPSIRLVSAKNYSHNLQYLKAKYAKKYLEIWNGFNNTDPIKYVYEDISIAAYLVTLWEQERERRKLMEKQTFLDLGCGNGLLVHILSSEGYKGKGIDLRKRKIWTVYGPETNLVEEAIEPSDKQLYPGYDWIIGNHPDELTPWIPVIASRSSYNTRVFLLPCCFYSFDGKYSRKYHQLSQYQSYIKFLTTLCATMGFLVEVDKLRIPSTKRLCLVCGDRNYQPEDETLIDKNRKAFINCNLERSKRPIRLNSDAYFEISTWNENEFENEENSVWASDFTPRNPVEKVRNCSKLDKTIIDETIGFIFEVLLIANNKKYILVRQGDKTFEWNRGGTLTILELCQVLNPNVLRSMKFQNGGLQTFLRNHSYIFDVKYNEVQLRVPSTSNSNEVSRFGRKRRSKRKLNVNKIKKCYFFFNHPDGCPLSTNDCSFSHEGEVQSLETL